MFKYDRNVSGDMDGGILAKEGLSSDSVNI